MTLLKSVISCAMGLTLSAGVASAEVDFSGQTITVVVPFGEGGGTSQVFGFFRPFLQEYLPGNPLVQLLNVPGGGSIRGANQFHNTQTPDGTYLLATSTSTIVNQAARNPLVEYDLTAYEPVVLLGAETHWFTSASVIDEPYDFGPILERPLALYALNSPSSADLFHVWTFHTLGITGAKPIPGLSSSAGFQAFLRGELQISSHGTSNYLRQVQPGLESGEFKDLMSFGLIQEDGTVARMPYSPDTPTFPEQYERIHGTALAGDQLEAYRSINAIWNQASKAMFLPTGTPDEIVEVWRDAFRAILEDPDFIAQAAEQLGPTDVIIGEEARDIVASASILSDATITQLNEALAANNFTYRIE